MHILFDPIIVENGCWAKARLLPYLKGVILRKLCRSFLLPDVIPNLHGGEKKELVSVAFWKCV